MPGGKGKSTGGKAGPKAVEGKTQKSHSAKAGLQVSVTQRGQHAIFGKYLVGIKGGYTATKQEVDFVEDFRIDWHLTSPTRLFSRSHCVRLMTRC